MASDWRVAIVQELVEEGILDRPIDGNHGELHPKTSDFVKHGIPFIMASDLIGGRVNTTSCAFITENQARALRKGFALPGDVLISHKATMGRTAIVQEGAVPFLMLTPQVTHYRVKDPLRLSNRYLKLYFDSPMFQQLLQAWSNKGSTRAYLGITAQMELPITLPPLEVQLAIAHILGTLDDKIELNRQMSEALEAMAQALFKSWFVDFDPVCAKSEGRDPDLPKSVTDLFPSRLVASDIGAIPEGWRVGRVDEEFELTMGQSPPGETYNEFGEGLPFYQGRADFGFRFPMRRVYCTAPTRQARAGDTLITVRAPVGDINMASEECAIGRGVAAARHRTGSRSYAYYFMHGLNEVFARFEAEGTVFGSIGKRDFHAIPCLIPAEKVVVDFENVLSPIDSRIEIA
ncbi:MAG: restriction endonuclease subunit S, partial [Vicinamibacterales bacterium]